MTGIANDVTELIGRTPLVRLAREEGILAGISSGAALWAASRWPGDRKGRAS